MLLVANIGSTSFKFRLFEFPSERVLAQGGAERIGGTESPWKLAWADGTVESGTAVLGGYDAAVRHFEERLCPRLLPSFSALDAVGFKPVMAKGVSGTQVLDERVLRAMEDLIPLFPAHNPPYVAAVRTFQRLFPALPCIGTFETAFYDHLPPEVTRYPVPLAWERDYGVRRYGFHGASHRYIAERAATLSGRDDLRLVSCHLGGSSSLCGIRGRRAVDSSWGMTAQSGLPHNNRVGDFDPYAALYLARDCGLGWDAVEKALSTESGLKGMSGLATGDVRDLLEAEAHGREEARVALAVFTRAIRRHLGSLLVALDGIDWLVFTAGIGENNAALRAAVCADLSFLGLKLDPAANAGHRGGEAVISTSDSKVEVRVLPTNEELVIARAAWELLGQLRPV